MTGLVALFVFGAFTLGIAVGFTLAWPWGYEQGQESVTSQGQTIYSSTEEEQP